MTKKIDTIVCIYLSEQDSWLLKYFYECLFGQVFIKDDRFSIYEIYADIHLKAPYVSQNKVYLNTPEHYSKLSLKTFEMIKYFSSNFHFSRLIKIDVTCAKLFVHRDNEEKDYPRIDIKLLEELILSQPPYDDYAGILFHDRPSRKCIENWAREKGASIDISKIFSDSQVMPSWYSGKCYAVSYLFAKYIADNGRDMAARHSDFLWGSEDMMVGRLYESFKKS